MNAPLSPKALGKPTKLDRLFALQRDAFARERFPSYAVRKSRVERLLKIVTKHEKALCVAVAKDFGHRSHHETRLAELFFVAAEARTTLRHLREWMSTRRVSTPLHLLPASSRILRQPLGVIGIISPWNYPIQLGLAPAIGALAAGNRVMLKPSELTPATSELIAELVSKLFADDEFAVVLGDAAVGHAFALQRWDHLFFTGSTMVGRLIALAAAENLVPVTLELGGKSPAIFDRDSDFSVTAPRLVSGKLLNAGQTCIAPCYAMVPTKRVDEFVAAVSRAVKTLYPTLAKNPDYTAVVNPRHYQRLTGIIEDARDKGARILPINPADEAMPASARKIAPTLILDVNDDMRAMQEEIFGPLLPVETYSDLDDAIARVNSRPHPLALYYFGDDEKRRERILRETMSGGVTINDTLLHFMNEALPFGGVGPSGQGAYHGEKSFVLFSNEKPVFTQSRYAGTRLLYPPYGALFNRMLGMLSQLKG